MSTSFKIPNRGVGWCLHLCGCWLVSLYLSKVVLVVGGLFILE